MELSDGYKRTEIGNIPEEWEVQYLDAIATTVASGRSKAGAVSGSYPVHGSTGVIGHTERPAYQGDAILVARVGANAGKLNIVSGEYGVTDNTIIVCLNKGFELPFFWRQLEAKRLNSLVFGSGQPLITGTQLKALLLPIPPLAEQRAIAAALSDADALIASVDVLIAKKRDLKQAAMQQLLTGKTRLPGFKGEWRIKCLGDIGSTFGGLTGKSKVDFGHGEGRYVTFMNIMSNVLIDTGAFELVDVKPAELQNKIAKGDLFFNGSSETPEEVGMSSLLAEDVEDVYLNSFCFGFRFRNAAPANGLYLAYYFRSNEGRQLLKSLAQGATRYNLSKRALLRVRFPWPEPDEQAAIANVLFDMDAELTALEAKRDKARALKQGMIQQLLTGRIRLR